MLVYVGDRLSLDLCTDRLKSRVGKGNMHPLVFIRLLLFCGCRLISVHIFDKLDPVLQISMQLLHRASGQCVSRLDASKVCLVFVSIVLDASH